MWILKFTTLIINKIKKLILVGAQIDLGVNNYLPGGADQVNLLLDRNVNLMDYLEIKSVKPIK